MNKKKKKIVDWIRDALKERIRREEKQPRQQAKGAREERVLLYINIEEGVSKGRKKKKNKAEEKRKEKERKERKRRKKKGGGIFF